jgi:hypothetical protein
MTKTHELDRTKQTATPAGTHDDAVAPGRIARSAALVGPNGFMPSGLIQRKARDANGVEEGAGDAVARASSSSGAALPEGLMRKFESSLGADLSGVRVHTGGESADAASAVGAKAYTLGQDIHFGAGHFDPSSSTGEHLLAHEVAHTVQQRGGVARMQLKHSVSSPGDSHEVEADRAADAMVSGGSFAISGSTSTMVSRDPARPGNASYANGNPNNVGGNQSGNGETERAESQEEIEAALAKGKAMAITKAAAFMAKSAGLTTSPQAVASSFARAPILQHAIDRVKAETEARDKGNGLFKHYEGHSVEIPLDLQGQAWQTATTDAELKSWLGNLTGRSQASLYLEDATKIADQINSAAQSLNKEGGQIMKAVTGMTPKGFSKVADVTKKTDEIIHLIDHINNAFDTTALSSMTTNPSFENAAMWGKRVGEVFSLLAPLGDFMKDVPGGQAIGSYVSGLMNVPQTVIAQFTDVVRKRYEKIDMMTTDCGQHPENDKKTCSL